LSEHNGRLNCIEEEEKERKKKETAKTGGGHELAGGAGEEGRRMDVREIIHGPVRIYR